MQQFCFATFCVPVQQMPQHIQRNLTRAAEALNLTQSAVSNSLKLLREHFHDEILIRDGRNMRLTEKSQGQAQRFVSTHSAIYNTFAIQRHLVTRKTMRTFRAAAFAEWRTASGADA
jgi:DNA-binding transcriptional LysR family regulator